MASRLYRTRQCENCGVDFKTRSHARTCTAKCRAILREREHRRPAPPRTCEWCGNEFTRAHNRAHTLYSRQRFCSKRCAGMARKPQAPKEEYKRSYRQITVNGRFYLEHRWVMEQHLGRPLRRDEQVHHINHDGLDNRIENLEVLSSAEHGRRHAIYPETKHCTVCGTEFTPSITKRARAKTCGSKTCRYTQTVRTRQARAA